MTKTKNPKPILLLVEVFIVSVCSLTYELLISTAVSNLTGNSVLSFSISVGLFLAGLGTGSYASKFISDKNLAKRFLDTESMLALVGGFSVILIYLAIGYTTYFRLAQVFLTFLIGLLSGLEIPILTRLLNTDYFKKSPLKNIIAEILSFDYFGGLLASLLFPLVLLPYFGLVRLSFLVGILNLCMAFLSLWIFWKIINNKKIVIFRLLSILFFLLVGVIFSSQIYNFAESKFYRDPIVYSKQTQYQRIVITKQSDRTRLYLNGNIQLNSLDEYRYHETLVFPSMAQMVNENNLKIAVLGGGDGMAVRELLKFEDQIESISLVDIDPEITKLASQNTLLTSLNQNSLNHTKVNIYNQDAQVWLQNQNQLFDLIIADFPDPDDTTTAKLYSLEFYKLIKQSLDSDGQFITQSSSILAAPAVFWSINKTLQKAMPELNIHPLVQYIPSFGYWGFNLVTQKELQFTQEHTFYEHTFYDYISIQNAFELTEDALEPRLNNKQKLNIDSLQINTLDNLILVNYQQIKGIERFN